ncbi:CPBP family intramembrane glutamic endopeptidase [Planctomicrobium sp. SH668]|uniref:CPBP family intramembrane glutamic endopeptidase n=1 Tax=Planctomicrobium sp. SH668 TaxID=3448126 RepID=UPI003F5CB641
MIIRNGWSNQFSVQSRYRTISIRLPVAATIANLLFLCVIIGSMVTSQGQVQSRSIEELQQLVRLTLLEGGIILTILVMLTIVSVPQRNDLIRLGFRCNQIADQIRLGGYGFLVAVLPTALALLATIPLRSEERLHPFLQLVNQSDSPMYLYLISVSAVVLAPLKEELMFRVLLQTSLEKLMNPAAAILLTAVVFAGVHGFPDAIGLLPLSLVLGVIYYTSRSYLAVVVVHALFNAYNLTATFLGE